MTPSSFKLILSRAQQRKGGKKSLQTLLSQPLNAEQLKKQSDAFYLSTMMRCIFNAGFQWRVVSKKWPNFERVFFNFEASKILLLSEEQWSRIYTNADLIRNKTKLKCIIDNALLIEDIKLSHGSLGQLIADWPCDDQIGLQTFFKKRGARLGGMTGQYFLRFSGWDSFILSRDVITCLQGSGLDIRDQPTSQRDLKKIQDTFNYWHQETQLSYTHLSQVAAFSISENCV